MRLPIYQALCWLILLCISLPALATHQVGGQIEMQAVGDVPGHFKIIVTNYLESNQAAARTTSGQIGIFRKRDNALLLSFYVYEISTREQVVFTNSLCANQRNQNVIVAVFGADIQLNPSSYNDALGYYMSYQTRNRNAGINNITNPNGTGFTFYLEFPALQRNGAYFNNSSPNFKGLNGEYICINQPFTYKFGGTDPDGDELRYSMITPLNQASNNTQMGGGGGGNQTIAPSAAPYPDVNWLSGFDANNAITGSPPLSVDPKTGELSVTANELGLYVFAVKVEEYRNGEKIGEVRRDFQFLVIDCPPPVKLDPLVNIVSYPTSTTSTTVCQGTTLALQTTTNSAWLYQWRRDGINLANATSTTLSVQEPGQYSVLVSLNSQCSKSIESDVIRITVIAVKPAIKEAGHLCATDGSVRFDVQPEPNMRYQWLLNGQPISGQTLDSMRVMQPGQYAIQGTQTQFNCIGNSESLTITRSAAVSATIRSVVGHNKLCPNDSLQLESGGGERYIWQKDGQIIAGLTGTSYLIKAVGTYSLTAIDGYGCIGLSTPLVVVAVPPIVVTMSPVTPVCGSAAAAYTLSGSPAGGIFSGSGVTGTEFSPALANVGDHVLIYGVKPAPECAPTIASQTAVVSPVPTSQMPDSIITFKGNTFNLEPALTGTPIWFNWQPPTYLDHTDIASPQVINIQKDIDYLFWTKNQYGCEVKDTIRIIVVERLWIPDAFTPNKDGVNDTWVLRGIEAFPEAEITVFNRWGEIIYWSEHGYSEPFDGVFKGDYLAAGPYAYVIRPDPKRPELRGTVFILR